MYSISQQQRKWTAISLFIFAVFIVGLGIRQANFTVRESLNPSKQSSNDLVISTPEEIAENSLRAKDTDGDGLNDFDELNLYNTSPYLTDSDSDGVTDKEEIDKGDDPNCPGNQDCYGAITNIVESSAGTESLPLGDILSQEDANSVKEVFPSDLSADDVRALMVAGGVSEDAVNAINDEELLTLYQQLYNEL